MASEEVAAGYVSLYARMDAASVASAIGGGISSSLGDIQGLLGGISSFTQGLGTALTLAGVVAARGISELAGSIVDAISIAENASITFETLGRTVMGLDNVGAAQFSDSFIGLLNQFAVRTPYEFSGLVTSARQLMAMGFTADQIVSGTDGAFEGILNSAGNAAAALGLTDQGFQNILLQIGHINAAGKPMAYNINALARNGINAWQMLADYMTNETGIETSIMDARAAVRAGKVDSETMLNALMAGFEQFDGQMERMSHTFTGVMSNLTDAMMVPIMSLRDSGGYRAMTDALYEFMDPLKELVYAITPTLDEIMGRVGNGVGWLTGMVENLTTALKNTDPGVIADTLQTIGGIILSGPFLIAFSQFVGLAGQLAGIGKKISGGLFTAIAGGLSGAGKAIGGLFSGKTFTGVTTVFSGLFSNVRSIFSSSTNMLGRIFSAAANPAQVTWGVQGAARGLQESFRAAFGQAGDGLIATLRGSSLYRAFGAIAPNLANKFESTVPQLAESLAMSFGRFAFLQNDKMTELMRIGGAINRVKIAAKPLAKIVGKEMSVAATMAAKAFKVFSRVMLTAGAGFGVVALGITAAIAGFTALGGNLRDVGKSIQNTLRTAAHVVSSFLENATTGMRKAIDDGSLTAMFDAVAAGLTMFGNTVGAVLPEFLDAFKDVAKVVAERLVSGFATYAPVVARGAMTMFTGILNGLTYVVGLIASTLPTLIPQIVDAIVGAAPQLVTAAATLVVTLADALTDNLPLIIAGAGEIALTFASEIGNHAPEVANAAYELFMGFLDAEPEIMGILVDVALEIVQSLADSISENPDVVAKGIENVIETALNNLPGFVIQTNKLALGILKAIAQAIVAIGPTLIRDALSTAVKMAMSNPLTSNAFNISSILGTVEGGADFDTSQFQQLGEICGALFAFGATAATKSAIDTSRIVPDSAREEVVTRIGALNNATTEAITNVGTKGAQGSLNAGKAIVAGFANGVKQSQPVKTAATNTGYVPSNTIKAIPTSTLTSSGVNMAKSFASGVGSSAAKSVASANASSLANSATKSMTSGKSSAFLWGYELGNNFARGIKSAYSSVKSAASSLAKAAALPLKHSTPKEGPLSDDDMWGYHMAQNFEQGMLKGVALVERGSLALASAVSNPFDVGMQPLGTFGTYQPDGYPYAYPYGTGDVYNIYLDGDLLGVDGRIGRAVAQLVGAVEQTYEMGRS